MSTEHGDKRWDGEVLPLASSAGKQGGKRWETVARTGSDRWLLRRRASLMPAIDEGGAMGAEEDIVGVDEVQVAEVVGWVDVFHRHRMR